LNNVGLLGRVAGKVVGIDEGVAFYLDDGSCTLSDKGFTGVKVISEKPVAKGQSVVVTGISSVGINDDGLAIRVLKTRGPEDVLILQ
jgi:D-arabinose 1-dehydrogenase-like Zn-dependent alcohol dehydrogenase